ncbi:MAG: hypothetical protein KDD19_12925, partial [Phaeodactylibacter sp.]|nr:hypothetical protein [Phaeodactylibacter sp.]
MSAKNIAIAYCSDNEHVVRQIEQQLSLAGYQFQHYAGTRTTAGVPLADQLLNQPNPILLIVSDNFLKAAQCMNRGLKLLQEKRNQILPVVIEGVAKDEQKGETIKIQTDFERVSDIIQYINFWQDQYLDLRRQKRQMKDFDEDAFNAHLKTMREISSEAGEFLRVLRGMNYLTHQGLVANGYEEFFKFSNDLEGWNRFKSKAAATLMALEPSAPVAEEAPAEEPVAPEITEEEVAAIEEPPADSERVEEEIVTLEKEFPAPDEAEVPPIEDSPAPSREEEVSDEEEPPVDLTEIPGIGLIQEAVEETEVPEEEEIHTEDVAEAIAAGIEEASLEDVQEEVAEELVVAGTVEEDENATEAFYMDDDEDNAL